MMELGTKGLTVSKYAEVLLNKIYPSLKNFPKAEKYALCSEIKEHFYWLIARIEQANAVPSLRKSYAKAPGRLQAKNQTQDKSYAGTNQGWPHDSGQSKSDACLLARPRKARRQSQLQNKDP